MKMTKKYVNEKISSLRNNIIESCGIIRNMLIILEETVKRQSSFPTSDLLGFEIKITEMKKTVNDANTHIISDIELKDDDIRLIIGGMRLISNLENITNNIINIFQICEKKEKNTEFDAHIAELTTNILEVFDKIFIAFTYREIDNCYEVIKEDEKIDIFRNDKNDKIIDIIQNDKNIINYGIDFTEIMIMLERIGDYIVNISEDIIYIFAGIDVRYSGEFNLISCN